MNHANLDPALRINLLTPQSQAKGLAVSKYAYKEHKKKGRGEELHRDISVDHPFGLQACTKFCVSTCNSLGGFLYNFVQLALNPK